MSQTFRLAGVKMKPFIRWYSSTVRSIPSFSIRVRLPHTMTTTPMQDTACVIRGGAGVESICVGTSSGSGSELLRCGDKPGKDR